MYSEYKWMHLEDKCHSKKHRLKRLKLKAYNKPQDRITTDNRKQKQIVRKSEDTEEAIKQPYKESEDIITRTENSKDELEDIITRTENSK